MFVAGNVGQFAADELFSSAEGVSTLDVLWSPKDRDLVAENLGD